MAQIINNQIPWPVVVEDQPLSLSQAEFQRDSSTAMLTYRVPREELRRCPVHFCGYSYRFHGPETLFGADTLRRVLPQPHPDWDWLWAHRVVLQGETSVVEGATNFRGTGLGAAGPVDAYKDYRASVFYTHRPYRLLTDEILADQFDGKEQNRFVQKLPGKPYTEFVQIEGGALRFVDTPTLFVNQGQTYRLPKVDMKWIWHEVPVRWVVNQAGTVPGQSETFFLTKISPRVGKINQNDWEAFPAGTLYLESVDTEEDYAPADAEFLRLGNVTYPPRYYRIEFNFKYFAEGWNKLPKPGTFEFAEVEFKDAPATGPRKKLYETTDFDELFRAA